MHTSGLEGSPRKKRVETQVGMESGVLGIENKQMPSRDLKCWEEERVLDPKGGDSMMTEKKVDEIKRF